MRMQQETESTVAEKIDDFTHAWMRRVEVKLDQIIDDGKEFRTRLGRLETSMADMHMQLAEHSVRMDKMNARLERIERRLDLSAADAVS